MHKPLQDVFWMNLYIYQALPNRDGTNPLNLSPTASIPQTLKKAKSSHNLKLLQAQTLKPTSTTKNTTSAASSYPTTSPFSTPLPTPTLPQPPANPSSHLVLQEPLSPPPPPSPPSPSILSALHPNVPNSPTAFPARRPSKHDAVPLPAPIPRSRACAAAFVDLSLRVRRNMSCFRSMIWCCRLVPRLLRDGPWCPLRWRRLG